MPNLVFAKQTYTHGVSNSMELSGLAVTAADGTDLPNGPCVGLMATGAGNINVDLVGAGTAVLTTLTANQIYMVACQRVRSTSTTATGIVALYHANGSV